MVFSLQFSCLYLLRSSAILDTGTRWAPLGAAESYIGYVALKCQTEYLLVVLLERHHGPAVVHAEY